MIKRRKSSDQGLLIFTSQNSQAHKIINNWNEYRVLEAEELHSVEVEKKEVKAKVKSKAEKVAEGRFVDPLATSILGYR